MAGLEDRNYQVLLLIYHFKQLTAHHVQVLLSLSKNPCYNSLNWLYDHGYIQRLEYPLSGGALGGSGHYVWTVATAGWRMLSDSPYRPARHINFHTLEIANTFTRLVQLEREGWFRIEGYTTEPDCWARGDGWELKPDLYVETLMRDGKLLQSFIEVDRATEGEQQVKGKLAAYIYAVDHAKVEDFPHWSRQWPRTVWVAYDAARATQLRRLIGQLPADDQALFKVCDRSGIADMFA